MQKKQNVMKELIGKTRKSEPHLPEKRVIYEQDVSGKEEIANEFNTFCTNIGAELVKNIPNASRLFESYIKKVDKPCQETLLQLTRSKRHFFHLKETKVPGVMR